MGGTGHAVQKTSPGGLTATADLYQFQIDSLDLPNAYQFDETSVVKTSIKHVDAATTLLNRHWDLFESARLRLDDQSDADSLNRRLLAFVEKWGDDKDVQALLRGTYYTVGDDGGVQIVQ